MPGWVSRGDASSPERIDVTLFFADSSVRRKMRSQRRFFFFLAVLAEQRHRTDE